MLKKNAGSIDKEIIKRFIDGDMRAFDIIYATFNKKLYAFLFKILKVEEDAKDILQEVFVRVWENRHQINKTDQFNAYLFKIAYNASIDLIRKKLIVKKHIQLYSLQIDHEAENSSDYDYNQINNKINLLVEELPDRQKEVFLLSRQDNLSHKEIAAKLNISVNTVENHISKALKYLKKHIDSQQFNVLLFFFLYLY